MNEKYWVLIGGAYERKFVVVEALACLRIRWQSPVFNDPLNVNLAVLNFSASRPFGKIWHAPPVERLVTRGPRPLPRAAATPKRVTSA